MFGLWKPKSLAEGFHQLIQMRSDQETSLRTQLKNVPAGWVVGNFYFNENQAVNLGMKAEDELNRKTSSATAEIDDNPHYNHETSFLRFSKKF